MSIGNMRRIAPMVALIGVFTSAMIGCGDDDTSDSDAGTAGTKAGGSGGKGGSSGSKAGSGGAGGKAGSSGSGGKSGAGGSAATEDNKAADLRVALNLLLGEHQIVAAKATGAALGGRSDESAAYVALLEANGNDLGDAVGAAFGDDAKDSFNTIWKDHNKYFVDYTVAVAGDDADGQAAAVDNLTNKYVPMFTDLISGATKLDKDTVKGLTAAHVGMTKAVVDAQHKKDWPATYKAIRDAFKHIQSIANPLAIAIAGQKKALFPGDPATKAVDFQVALNQLLQEHLYLATFATNAALNATMEEFDAAGAKLGDNGSDIASALDGLYGSEAADKFKNIWNAHNTYFVNYTVGVKTDDKDKRDGAVSDLTTKYVPMFAEFLAGATDLPEDTLKTLTGEHVTTTKTVVDDQHGTDHTKTAEDDRKAGQHMQMIGDPLAKAIVKKLPDKF